MSFRKYLSVLKNINFTKLWISQCTSQLTNYILSFAILFRVFDLTHSTLSVAIVIMAFGLATVIFGSIAGVYADRYDRRWLLTIINFAQAASIALYFVVGGNFWGLVIITFIYSSLNQFYLPVEAPTIPHLVPPEQILVANSYFTFTSSASLIVGFASAGPIILAFGQKGPFVAGVILLLIAGFATLLLPPLKPFEVTESHPLKKIWGQFSEGVGHFWKNKLLHFPLLSLIFVQIINGMVITIAPSFIQNTLKIQLEKGSLLVVAPLGLGILFGSLALGFEEKYFKKKDLVFAGFLGMGLMIFALSLTNLFIYKFVYYSLVGFGIGFFNAHIFAPSHSLLQTHSVHSIRGRIYGSLYVLLQIAATLPTVIVGVIADRLSLAYVVAGLGVALFLLGIFLRPMKQEAI